MVLLSVKFRCNSKDISQSPDSRLKTGYYDTVILDIGVNDLFNDRS